HSRRVTPWHGRCSSPANTSSAAEKPEATSDVGRGLRADAVARRLPLFLLELCPARVEGVQFLPDCFHLLVHDEQTRGIAGDRGIFELRLLLPEHQLRGPNALLDGAVLLRLHVGELLLRPDGRGGPRRRNASDRRSRRLL